jgi:hypothetical protein
MLQVSAYKLGKKEEMKLEEPKPVKVKNSELYNFDFEKFDKQLDKAIELLYPENYDECKAYTMLAAKHDETFPLGVILFKTPEFLIEKEALKLHLRKFIEKLDE